VLVLSFVLEQVKYLCLVFFLNMLRLSF